MRLATRVSTAVLALMTFQSGYGINSAIAEAFSAAWKQPTKELAVKAIDDVIASYKAAEKSDSKTDSTATDSKTEDQANTSSKTESAFEKLIGGLSDEDKKTANMFLAEATEAGLESLMAALTDSEEFATFANDQERRAFIEANFLNGLVEKLKKAALSTADVEEAYQKLALALFYRDVPVPAMDAIRKNDESMKSLAGVYYKTFGLRADAADAATLGDPAANLADDAALDAVNAANAVFAGGNAAGAVTIRGLVRAGANAVVAQQNDQNSLDVFLNAAVAGRAADTGSWLNNNSLTTLKSSIQKIISTPLNDEQALAAWKAIGRNAEGANADTFGVGNAPQDADQAAQNLVEARRLFEKNRVIEQNLVDRVYEAISKSANDAVAAELKKVVSDKDAQDLAKNAFDAVAAQADFGAVNNNVFTIGQDFSDTFRNAIRGRYANLIFNSLSHESSAKGKIADFLKIDLRDNNTSVIDRFYNAIMDWKKEAGDGFSGLNIVNGYDDFIRGLIAGSLQTKDNASAAAPGVDAVYTGLEGGLRALGAKVKDGSKEKDEAVLNLINNVVDPFAKASVVADKLNNVKDLVKDTASK